MEKELILLREYCAKSHIEPDFVLSLEDEGLIEVEMLDEERYIQLEQLEELEMFSRLHHDLSINIAGLDVIHNLLTRIKQVEQELFILKREMNSHYIFLERDYTEEF